MSDWIKLHRKIMDSPAWDLTDGHLRVFMTCLLLAEWKPTKAIFRGKQITLRPGQLLISTIKLAESCGKGMSRSKVVRALQSLRNLKISDNESDNKNTLITISNWEYYQKDSYYPDNESDNDRTTTGQREIQNPLYEDLVSTPKKYKNIKNNTRDLIYLSSEGQSPRCKGESPRQKAMSPTVAANDAEFERWYLSYPRRCSKAKARLAYEKARKKASAEQLIEGVHRYINDKPAYADWKMPATWLNQECWEDDYNPISQPPPKRGSNYIPVAKKHEIYGETKL